MRVWRRLRLSCKQFRIEISVKKNCKQDTFIYVKEIFVLYSHDLILSILSTHRWTEYFKPNQMVFITYHHLTNLNGKGWKIVFLLRKVYFLREEETNFVKKTARERQHLIFRWTFTNAKVYKENFFQFEPGLLHCIRKKGKYLSAFVI